MKIWMANEKHGNMIEADIIYNPVLEDNNDSRLLLSPTMYLLCAVIMGLYLYIVLRCMRIL